MESDSDSSKRKLSESNSFEESNKKVKTNSLQEKEGIKFTKVHVSGLPPNVNEAVLFDHFKTFGQIHCVNIVRDKLTGISRGFGFITFCEETDAETAVNLPQHKLDGRLIRVNPAVSGEIKAKYGQHSKEQWTDLVNLPNDQKSIYVGPLEDHTKESDLQAQFVQFGAIREICIKRSFQTSTKKGFGLVKFVDQKSLARAFGGKTFVLGKQVVVALSRFALEVALSDSVVFFYDAHVFVEERDLEKYFSKFGQVYRAIHLSDFITLRDSTGLGIVSRSYGFVDFVSSYSARECHGQRTQLIPPEPGQYVRIGEHLPHMLKQDFLSISESDSEKLVRRLEKNIPIEGQWGTCELEGMSSNKVKLSNSLVSKLIGEGGKKISEICRDTKTQISVAPLKPDSGNVLITVSGKRDDVLAAMYVMQKIMKSE